jgi:hypothetical protein
LSAPAESAALLAAVDAEVTSLERLSEALEAHLVAGQWDLAAEALSDGRRSTHAYLNAMEAAAAVRTEEFDKVVYARMRRIFDVREDQLTRLRAFHHGVGERLQTLSRWKHMAQSMGGKQQPRRAAGLDRMS